MKLQDVLLKAMAKKLSWMEAAEIAGVTDRRFRCENLEGANECRQPFCSGQPGHPHNGQTDKMDCSASSRHRTHNA